ncbi:MAG: hypothetical protein ACTSWY_08535, partial [Promethearchaeota archaeon]
EINKRENLELQTKKGKKLFEKMYWLKTSFKYNGPIYSENSEPRLKKTQKESKYNYNVNLNYSSYFMPLYLKIPQDMGKINIYLNGFPIGRYWEVGPQFKFYLPEPLLKRENDLTMFVNTDGRRVIFDKKFEINSYQILKKIKIKVNFVI